MELDFAILLAWPETKCKQAGSWYDPVMTLIGVNKFGYYKVGHAAIILISGVTGECQYYDFGRYHAPKGFGRVRSKFTDHELELFTRIRFSADGTPLNITDLFEELNSTDVWHGEGEFKAGLVGIDLDKTRAEVEELISREFIPYGPFVRNGTNCSRFVQRAAVSGMEFGLVKLGLSFPLMLSPTPAWNTRITRRELIKVLNHEFSIETEIA